MTGMLLYIGLSGNTSPRDGIWAQTWREWGHGGWHPVGRRLYSFTDFTPSILLLGQMFGLIGCFPKVYQLFNIFHITSGWAVWIYEENSVLDGKNSKVKALSQWLGRERHDMELWHFQESSPEYTLYYLTMPIYLKRLPFTECVCECIVHVYVYMCVYVCM